METDPRSLASIQGLRELLREASLIQARQYFSDDAVTLTPGENSAFKLGQVVKHHMALIILNSQELQMVLKVHFNADQVQAYHQRRHGADRQLEPDQLIDFMKELSNQMGGRVCRVFNAHQIAMGMSVPLCTRGIYELYTDYESKMGAVSKFGDFWRLDGPFGDLYCSAYVELSGDTDFSQFHCADEDAHAGELDFL